MMATCGSIDMSLVEESLSPRELGHFKLRLLEPQQMNTDDLRSRPQLDLSNLPDADEGTQQSHASPIYDDFCAMYEREMILAPLSPKTLPLAVNVPDLPAKSTLRASRFLNNLTVKTGAHATPVQPPELTPHDVYMSSEEDVSSTADDFSDYDYDSSDEGSPVVSRRGSQEDTARMVSVVFAGKPSIVELSSLRRQSVSPKPLQRVNTSSLVTKPSCISPASSVSSPKPLTRASTHFTKLVKKPDFLSIDPYANISSCSTDLLSTSASDSRTPTKQVKATSPQLLRHGVSRTFSLVRKRSRPLLSPFNSTQSAQPASEQVASPSTMTVSSSRRPTQSLHGSQPSTPVTPLSPSVTHDDIFQAARRNTLTPTAQQPITQISPQRPKSPSVASPVAPPTAKRGLLSGLAARRRSLKFSGKLNIQT